MSDARTASPVDLAREANFALGALNVSPSTREVFHGETRELLEPRVMQVLVALHRAVGAVVSRDELIASCWEGRVVGEDAINRAVGRLRRLSEASAAFEIETIPRVGYRLTAARASSVDAISQFPPLSPVGAPAPSPTLDRRLLIAGGGALAVAATGAAYWAYRTSTPSVSSEIADRIKRAALLQREGTPEGTSRCIALLEQIVQQAPQAADAWGLLAVGYAFAMHGNPAESVAMRLRALDAIARAVALDPHNAAAYEARGWMLPRRGAWLKAERIFREGLQYHPGDDGLLLGLVHLLSAVGRNVEAADLAQRAVAAVDQLDPSLAWNQIQVLWAAHRLVEADEAASHNIALFPRQPFVWFSRLYVLMFTGRVSEASAMVGDIDNRPPGIADEDFDCAAATVKALQSRDLADVTAAVASHLAMAHKGAGYAENALQALSALGHIDDAFMVANGLYFDRGFAVSIRRFSAVQRVYTTLEDRRTRPLFSPATKPMRRDPRFARLVDELGLTRYWRDAGVKPDYQLGRDG